MVDPLEERCRAINGNLGQECARLLNSTLGLAFTFLNGAEDCLRSGDGQRANARIEKTLRAHDLVVQRILSHGHLIDSQALRIIEGRLLDLEAALQALLSARDEQMRLIA